MPKIVVNACYGGFSLSHAAIMRYGELAGINLQAIKGSIVGPEYYSYCVDGIIDDDHMWYYHDLERSDPYLVQVVEELGKSAAGAFATLRIADVPDDVEWYIDDYDGIETVCETHRRW
jgi:hypothetical protein